MGNNYLDILAKNTLNIVKKNVNGNYIVLDEEQEKKVDVKILEAIKDILDKSIVLEVIKKHNENKNDNCRINSPYIINSLSLYYVALYNDNLELLHHLLDNNLLSISNQLYDLNLFILDKRISSNFETGEYIDVLKGNIDLFKNFYVSLKYEEKNNNAFDSNAFIKKFVSIIKKNKDIAKVNLAYGKRVDDLLNVWVLNNFSEEEILNLNDVQKYMLNGTFEKDAVKRFKVDLIKNYNYSKNLIYWSDYYKYFAISEILNFSDCDIEVYNALFRGIHFTPDDDCLVEFAIEKIKHIKSISPDFNHQLAPFVYKVLNEKQIIGLTEEGKGEIGDNISSFALNRGRYGLTEKDLKRWIKNAQRKDAVKKLLKMKNK